MPFESTENVDLSIKGAGLLLGNGIYFHDSIEEAVWSCKPARELNRGFLLLCEVAVGQPYETLRPDPQLDAIKLRGGLIYPSDSKQERMEKAVSA